MNVTIVKIGKALYRIQIMRWIAGGIIPSYILTVVLCMKNYVTSSTPRKSDTYVFQSGKRN